MRLVLEMEKDKTSNTCFNADIAFTSMQIKRMLNGTFNAGEKMKSTEVYKTIKEWAEYFKNIIKRIIDVLEQKAMSQE